MPPRKENEQYTPPQTYAEYEALIDAMDDEQRAELQPGIFNAALNAFCSRHQGNQLPVGGYEAAEVPYFGWGWREVDFWNRRLHIAQGPDPSKPRNGRQPMLHFAFCENNKWDHPWADVTEKQAEAIVGFLITAWKIEGTTPCSELLASMRMYMNEELELDPRYQDPDLPF